VSQRCACAYIGSVDRVDHQANATFANELGQLLARDNYKNIGQLLREVYEHLERELSLRKARLAFLTYRLTGDPLLDLFC
jgi:hypothetical protein